MGNFLPRIGLVTVWGGASETLVGAASGSTSLWNIAAELSGPLFKGGLLYSEYKAQQAIWEETKANYELTALNAFAEVSNTLTQRRLRRDQRSARSAAVDQLSTSVRLSLLRYQQGLANYFEVLQAQQDLFPAKLDLSETRLQERLATVNLYRALGGGWRLDLDWLPENQPDKVEAESPITPAASTTPQ
jgi:multidrug efflux system outer membrane protein